MSESAASRLRGEPSAGVTEQASGSGTGEGAGRGQELRLAGMGWESQDI